MESEKTIKIYSYKKVWNVEKKIYTISKVTLPVPINPFDLVAYLGAAIFIVVLGKIFPVIASMPMIIRVVLVPYGMTYYLVRVKLDGKNPFKFLIGYIQYFFTEKGQYLQQFRKNPERQQTVKMNWECSMGID